jgi:hypothetical protein
MTKGARIPSDELYLDAAWFGVTQWCPLVDHACTFAGCHCECHTAAATVTTDL